MTRGGVKNIYYYFHSSEETKNRLCVSFETFRLLLRKMSDLFENEEQPIIDFDNWDEVDEVDVDSDLDWEDDPDSLGEVPQSNSESPTSPATASSASSRKPDLKDGSAESLATLVMNLEARQKRQARQTEQDSLTSISEHPVGNFSMSNTDLRKLKEAREARQTDQDALTSVSENPVGKSSMSNTELGILRMDREARQKRQARQTEQDSLTSISEHPVGNFSMSNTDLRKLKEAREARQTDQDALTSISESSVKKSSMSNTSLGEMVRQARQVLQVEQGSQGIPTKPTKKILEELRKFRSKLSYNRNREREAMNPKINHEMKSNVLWGGKNFITFLVGWRCGGEGVLKKVKDQLADDAEFQQFVDKHLLVQASRRVYPDEKLSGQDLYELFLKRLYQKDANELQIWYLYKEVCKNDVEAFVRIVCNW